MTAKDYLSQALRLQRRIEALTDRQRRYREMGWSCGEDGRRRMLAMARELDARVAEYTEKAADREADVCVRGLGLAAASAGAAGGADAAMMNEGGSAWAEAEGAAAG